MAERLLEEEVEVGEEEGEGDEVEGGVEAEVGQERTRS